MESYLNSLPNDIETIILCNKKLTNLPDLSRFTKLKKLDCSDNQLTSLPENLPTSLEELTCSYNQLTSLPENLPISLQILDCSGNQLIHLPENLPPFIEQIHCIENPLVKLPNKFPNSLYYLEWNDSMLISLPETYPHSLKDISDYSEDVLEKYSISEDDYLQHIVQKNQKLAQFRKKHMIY